MRSLERIATLLPRCSSVCPFVCLSGTDMHRDRTVHFSAGLSLWLDRPMFWAPWHQSTSTNSQPSLPSFFSSTWKLVRYGYANFGVISQVRLKIEVKLLRSANGKSIGTTRMTLSDLHCLKSTSSASRAISAVAELLVNIRISRRINDRGSVQLNWASQLWCYTACPTNS